MSHYNYATYESYKESGFNWVGDVPKHWAVEKLGSTLNAVSQKNQPDLPLLSITREQGVIERDLEDQDSNHNFVPDDLSGYKVLREGQFGMNKMKAWQGSYGVSAHTGIVSPAYFIFDFCRDVDPKFFNIAIRSKLYVSYFGSASDGVRIGQWDLNQTRMRQIPILLPSLEEQRAIAAFLDDKCAKIDEAVRIKEAQIKLLRERRQILIQQAVTRGLNPNAPIKDSGIDWIGQIPAHWEIMSNRRVFREKTRPIIDRAELPLSLSQVDGVVPSKHMKERSLAPSHRNNFKLCLPGDLVVNRFKGHLGVFFESKYRGIVTFHYGVFEPVLLINTRYFELLYHTEIYKTVYAGASNGMTVGLQNLSNQNFYMVKTISPPKCEQDQIVAAIDSESANIDRAISLKMSQIEYLKEYKTTLINAAVTGKIKVGEPAIK